MEETPEGHKHPQLYEILLSDIFSSDLGEDPPIQLTLKDPSESTEAAGTSQRL